jgi:hypothetical protein
VGWHRAGEVRGCSGVVTDRRWVVADRRWATVKQCNEMAPPWPQVVDRVMDGVGGADGERCQKRTRNRIWRGGDVSGDGAGCASSYACDRS